MSILTPAEYVFLRVIQVLDINAPIENAGSTVGELIEFATQTRGVSPDEPVELKPDDVEIERIAFRRLQHAAEAAGGRVPESDDSPLHPKKLVPRKDWRRHWKELWQSLDCPPPDMMPGPLWWAYAVAISTYLLVWRLVIWALKLESDPATVVGWFGFAVVWLATHLGGLLVGAGFALLLCPRCAIPFNSISETVRHLKENSRQPIADELRGQWMTIPELVIRIVAEEYHVPASEVDARFEWTTPSR